MPNILLISGSASTPSVNTATLREAAAWIEADTEHTVSEPSLALDQIPFYALQIEEAGDPDAVEALRASVQAADAVLFFTPQHNGRFPALLQNALAWLNRGEHRHILTGKPVGVVSVSPGARGGAKANEDLRVHLAGPYKARVIEPAVVVGECESKAGSVFSAENHGAELEALTGALFTAEEAPEAP